MKEIISDLKANCSKHMPISFNGAGVKRDAGFFFYIKSSNIQGPQMSLLYSHWQTGSAKTERKNTDEAVKVSIVRKLC